LAIPKTLAINSGYDAHEAIIKLTETFAEAKSEIQAVGLDLESGEPCIPNGIYDNVCVKRSSITACHNIASHLLEVDEVLRAGLSNLKNPNAQQFEN